MNGRDIEVIRLSGLVPYREAYERQIERRRAVERGEANNALFILEHHPVLTLGRKTEPGHVLLSEEGLHAMGIEVINVDRGGDVTYHGPGQLVAYPILDLRQWKPSVSWYLRALEEVIIQTLAVYGLAGERIEGYTGVWVEGAKVAQIGIGVHNWVSFHGIAINVAPDMTHFDTIVPCGISDRSVTSMARLTTSVPTLAHVQETFVREFLEAFS